MKRSLALLPMVLHLTMAFAQQRCATSTRSICVNVACEVQSRAEDLSLREMCQETKNLLEREKEGPQRAKFYFRVAEMMRWTGDYRALEFYEKAIHEDKGEACYESFYADYLRNFRGASGPLFPQAEQHYFEGLNKLGRGSDRAANDEIRAYIERGLSALYEQDGVALATRQPIVAEGGRRFGRPVASLSTIDRYAHSTADLDDEADVRDYTAEAELIISRNKLKAQPLPQDQLDFLIRNLIRIKKAAETLDRIRFRDGGMPVIDLFYVHRQTDAAQVTQFNNPTSFNELRLNRYGVTVQKPLTVAHSADVSLSGTFEVDQRWGLLEFNPPHSKERIFSYSTQDAVSHFFGPDKATVGFTYAYQMIHPEIPMMQTSDRHRQFVGSTATYEIFRHLPFLQSAYAKRFETRGWDFFSGFLHDTDSFGTVNIRRHDYFIGTALKGLGPFDFTLQPTWFTSDVTGDPLQHNSQYRTNFTTLLRIIDEERNAGIPTTESALHLGFIHLVVPVKFDTAIAGLKTFENYKVGGELDIKLFTYARWMTLLASARYDYQTFYRAHKHANIATVSASLGF